MLFLLVYDQQHVTTLVRDWTADQLYQALQREQFGTSLPLPDQRVLAALLVDWQRRALGQVMLRDAMLVDQRRGAQVYRLLCYSQIRAAQPIPEIAAHLFTPCVPQPDLAHLHTQITALAAAPDCPPPTSAELYRLADVVVLAQQPGMVLHCVTTDADGQPQPIQLPLPDNLLELLPTQAPTLMENPVPRFEPPTGWRRNIAAMLAVAGVIWLLLPLMFGQTPVRPAGVPLGLVTLSLLIGVKAQWRGYVGSVCLWLVPNLPWFHHGEQVDWLRTLPFLLLGMLLISLDQPIRALWRWLWRG